MSLYIICDNPDCDEVLHSISPLAIPFVEGPVVVLNSAYEDLTVEEQLKLLAGLATSEHVSEAQASKLDAAFQQLNTASAFDDVPRSGETNEDMASSYGGTAESTGSVTSYEDPYVKHRERELELLAERQAADIRLIDAKAKRIELENKLFIREHNLDT